MNKSESIIKISTALVKAQSEMGSATKDAKNPFFKSSYADLNAVREATIPVLNKNGITVLQPMTVFEGKSYVETTLLHESGEFLTSLTEIIVAKQNDPQAAGSAQSYARRYGLQSFLCVGAEDDDGEKSMGRSVKAPPAKVEVAAETKTLAVDNTVAPKKGFGVKAEAAKVATPTTDEWS